MQSLIYLCRSYVNLTNYLIKLQAFAINKKNFFHFFNKQFKLNRKESEREKKVKERDVEESIKEQLLFALVTQQEFNYA